MIRILAFAALVLILGLAFSWLADRPGELSLLWQGQLIEMSLMVAASLLASLIAAIMIVWWLVRTLWTSPHSVTRYFRARKRDRGYQALSTGLIAAGAGNAALATKMAQRARSLISADQEPLIHLLEAQAALIEGRHDTARKKFEEMVEDPETRELGLRGLHIEATRLGAHEAARQYAEQAAEKAPYLTWAAQAALEYRCRLGDWDESIRLLDQQRVAHVLDRKTADRLKAVLLTAKASDRLEGDPAVARDNAVNALKLAPGFVPAALIAAKGYFREDNLRKGTSVLEQAWKASPHPDIADLYVRARTGDSALDRLKRAERLETLKPNNIESLIAVSKAALDARDFAKAREKAEAAARVGARESVYLLLADIEENDTGDQGRIRHWLVQARRAPRDPAWTADGILSDTWAPVSPVSGKLDAFEWKVPGELSDSPIEEGSLASTSSVEEALRTLPPVRETPPAFDVPEARPAPEDHVIDLRPAAPPPAPAATASSPIPEPKGNDAPIRKSREEKPVVQPFFGGAPDDPGVKKPGAEPEPKNRLRLF